MITFCQHPPLRRALAARRRGLALLAALSFPAGAQQALPQQELPPSKASPPPPAEISKPAPTPDTPSNGPPLQAHPSPTAAAHAQRAARSGAPEVPDPPDSATEVKPAPDQDAVPRRASEGTPR
jgi:hypothetical protein